MPFLRYFYVISYVLVISSIVILITFGRYFIENNLILGINKERQFNIVRYIVDDVWRGYERSLAVCARDNIPEERCIDGARIQQTLFSIMKHFSLFKLTIYTREGNIFFYSGKFPQVVGSSDDMRDFLNARRGKVSARYLPDYYATPSGNVRFNVVRSFVPIIPNSNQPDRIPGVIEIIHDVGSYWGSPLAVQMVAIILSVLLFSIIFGTMYFTTYKTEQLINKQYEANVELVHAKKSAEEQNREKSQFLANISHELRTPLNAIIGFSEIIKDEVMGPLNNEQYKEYVNDINLSGIHLLSLINDILDFSKAEAGKLKLDFADTDVTKIVQNSVRLMRPRADEAGVELIASIPKEHFILHTDGKRLKQVVLNLLSNSVKFTQSGGRVKLELYTDDKGEMLVMDVSDTGVGIAEKDVSKVMSSFGQVENELSRKYEGTGLGLPLSLKLVRLMGGDLHLESQINVGTTVRIMLPMNSAEKA